jgi:hypothetical protein
MSMIVLRIPTPTHFRVRALEWGLSWIMLAIGLCLFIPFPTLDQPAFVPIRQWGDDAFWGCVLSGLSSIRIAALWRNGGWEPSPIIRAATAVLSSAIWALFALGLANAFVLLPIFIGFVLADIYSVGRAASDARLTRDERLKQPEAPKVLSVPS